MYRVGDLSEPYVPPPTMLRAMARWAERAARHRERLAAFRELNDARIALDRVRAYLRGK
jgi:hypothetical protein